VGRGPSRRPLCAVSIDVDPIPCYYRIHGLGPAPDALRDVVARRALPRFAEVFARRGVEATFFLVGEDLDVAALGPRARAVRTLAGELARAGHELANHSYAHPYELARLGRDRVRDEIGRADQLIAEIGGRVRGFRAPGYDLSRAMLDELVARGYLYDSSIFPAPAYYAAKVAVMAVLAARRRPSGAVLTDPRALVAPAEPYRPSPRSPFRRGDAALLELPIAVSPGLRLPAIGTSLLLAPTPVRERLVAAMRRRRLFNLELHGIDLIDAEDDGIPGELVARQPDLRRSLADKLAALEAVLGQIGESFEVVRLDAAAERLLAEV
jgi:hypothetical protein